MGYIILYSLDLNIRLITNVTNNENKGTAIIECVIPRWYLIMKSGPKIATIISISGKIEPSRNEIVAILPKL